MIKVALDCNIGKKTHDYLIAKGFDVVLVAKEGEKDVSWVLQAVKRKALFIISYDLDIPSIIETRHLPIIWVSADRTCKDKHKLIVKNILNKLLFINNISFKYLQSSFTTTLNHDIIK